MSKIATAAFARLASAATDLLGAFTAERRLYAIEAEGELAGLQVEGWSLREALGTPWRLELNALALAPDLDLQAMLGKKLSLLVTLADGSHSRRTGIVTDATAAESDGGLARYALVVQPWLALLAYTRRSQLWQDKSLVQIVESVFDAYRRQAAWRWAADTAAHLAASPFSNADGLRSTTTQYRETDLAFVHRLLTEEGLVYRFEPDEAAPTGQRLVILADSADRQSCPVVPAPVRFHRAASVETEDAVQAFGGRRTLQAATTTVLAWDYKAKRAVATSVPTAAAFGGPNAPRLEAYDPTSPSTYPTSTQADRAGVLNQQALEARHKTWLGRSTVRSFASGQGFELVGSPLDDLASLGSEPTDGRPADSSDPAARRTFLLTEVVHAGINNLPKEVARLLSADHRSSADLLASWVDPELRKQAEATGYANRFEAIRSFVPWRPVAVDGNGARLNPRPTASGMQTATVVGPAGERVASGADEIHTDVLGRIRVQFHFQDPASGLGASQGPDTANTSAWVRVLQRYAGPGMGLQFIPRIGQEVLVDFIEGDIDRPVVVCALYDGRGEAGVPATPGGAAAKSDTADTAALGRSTDATPGAQGNLTGGNSPAWHGAGAAEHSAGGQRNAAALSGVKTKEFGGDGFNQLVFDDSDRQLRTQLATTQHATQLNLGHLVHQADNHRGSFRGTGFELRTDAYGAIRAKNGVLLTSYGTASSEPAGDNAGAIALAKQMAQLGATLSQAAKTHETVPLAAHLGSSQAGQSSLSTKEAPLRAMQTALQGMVAEEALDPAQADARAKATGTADGKLPHTTDPIVAISARAGLGVIAGQDIQMVAGEGIAMGAGRDSHWATGGASRIHTGQAIGMLAGAIQPGDQAAGTGLTLIAAHDDLEVQAQADRLQVAAKKDVSIQSRSTKIDWAAAKKITLSTAGGANITIEGGNITVQCPGTITIKAGVKSFVGAEKASYALPVMPVGVPAPLAESRLESTFAFDQLTTFARKSTKVEFVALVVPIFGFDIPAKTYIKLYDALRNGAIRNARIVLMTGGHYPAAFDNKTREIRVHLAAAERAATDNEEAWGLLTVLLHEFGHYIDAVLRQDLAEKNADGTSSLAGDASGDEGAKFAYEIAAFDLATSSNAVFAQYTSPKHSGPLRVNYNAVRRAIQAAQGEEAQRDEGKSGTLEHFGAGRGEHAKGRPQSSFGHESIEDALAKAGFEKDVERRQIYFGNWLRDFSQILDPKIVRPPQLPKNLGRYLSREALTKLVAIKAEVEFGETREARKLFAVTTGNLGVYRPVEHIDNPTNNDPRAADPRSVDRDFEPLPTPVYLKVDPATSMKRYIVASRDYMKEQMGQAAAKGASPLGRRHFGAGLHVLEDYFAHSNFVELSLRKAGYDNVLPWTSKAQGKHPYPIVTGMFDSEDVIASTFGMIADTLFKVKFEFQASRPGERTPSDRAMLILLEEHSDPAFLKNFEEFLWMRDKWASVPGHQYVEALSHYTLGMIGNLYNFVYNSLLHLIANSVSDEQVYLAGDPNVNGSTDPTHSQLAKDHDNHPFHTLAAHLAKVAVEQVGKAMAAHWRGDAGADPGAVAASFLVHPFDSTWQDELVSTWAKSHASQIKRGESSTEWESLRKEHEREVRGQLKKLGERSRETWNYLNSNYEQLFGQKNQVKK